MMATGCSVIIVRFICHTPLVTVGASEYMRYNWGAKPQARPSEGRYKALRVVESLIFGWDFYDHHSGIQDKGC